MRLIDADAFKKDLKACTMSCGTLINTNTMLALLDKYPTAYDVEKVAEELEDIKEEVSGCYGTMCYECKYTKNCYTGELSYKVAIDNAISVVRKGGVE